MVKHITDNQIRAYVIEVGTRQTEIQQRLREETLKLPNGMMMTTPAAGQLMALLIRAINARKILEIGTFTGYSALSMASVLPSDGRVTALDKNEEWTTIARRYWQEASVEDQIDLRLGDAVESLEALLAEGNEATYDFALIDADKEGYDQYYEACLKLLRPGGLLFFDNMFWGRSVADENDNSSETEALRALNLKIRDDERVDMALIPFGDGTTFVRVR